MEIAELEEALKVVNSCVSKIKWRLRPAAKRRLETDILALCTGLRPLIMVDYGGKMPELQEQLCDVLQLSQKESSILQPLRVMVMDDMIYLLHVKGLADYVKLSLNKEVELIFVDLEKDPLKMIAQADQHFVAAQLVLVQKFFSTIFLSDGLNESFTFSPRTDHVANGELTSPRSSELINLSSCMQDNQVTIPTLNG
ncbi:hypothetical protein GIB67_019402 [Kingdonia uniflora]|uniref:Uncharacterized protein n=1 Tax=Kingdonia uniflora TaxID=39325 RepID=A0A7J7MBM2_9MAGN|nr:hypothetical protein GIB67_019402 [Kingdonia uniflora]